MRCWAPPSSSFRDRSIAGPQSVQPAPNSVRVRRRIALATPALAGPYARLQGGPDLALRYVDYLVFLHTVIRASVPLMIDAVERLAAMPAAALPVTLRAYFERHIPEEEGHDEWLLQDLEILGRAREEVLATVPSVHVAAAVGAQYYWIRHHHPVALLGYIAVLEGHPPTMARVREWMKRTGLPEEAFRTLEQHAVADPTHNEELDAVLDELPLSEAHLTCVCVSGMATAANLAQALDDVAG